MSEVNEFIASKMLFLRVHGQFVPDDKDVDHSKLRFKLIIGAKESWSTDILAREYFLKILVAGAIKVVGDNSWFAPENLPESIRKDSYGTRIREYDAKTQGCNDCLQKWIQTYCVLKKELPDYAEFHKDPNSYTIGKLVDIVLNANYKQIDVIAQRILKQTYSKWIRSFIIKNVTCETIYHPSSIKKYYLMEDLSNIKKHKT